LAAKTKTRADAAESAVATETRGQTARRVPLWALGLAGALVAGGIAAAVEKMRFGPPLVMIALGGLTLVLSAVALWRVIDPLSGSEGPAAAAARAPRRMRELEREKQLVLKAIKEIELDYQMRKIAEGDYREMIERYRARAMRLISEIEAGDNYRELIERELKDRLAALAASSVYAAPEPPPPAAPTPAAAPHTCAACGKTNDEDAQFCKQCGAKLANV